VLKAAQVNVLSTKVLKKCTMFLLSESSFFVFPRALILKTCGGTVLLKALPEILVLALTLGLEVEFCCFTRRNYLFKSLQVHPHGCFSSEVGYLNQFFATGSAFVFGPMNSDHLHLYVADYTGSCGHVLPGERMLEIMMVDLSAAAMKWFFSDDNGQKRDAMQTTIESKIAEIIPNSVLDPWQFEPCGYSLNGCSEEGFYWTIHITPEDRFSFVSFETNLATNDYAALIEKVLSIFCPGRFLVTLWAEQGASARDLLNFDLAGFNVTSDVTSQFLGSNICLRSFTEAIPSASPKFYPPPPGKHAHPPSPVAILDYDSLEIDPQPELTPKKSQQKKPKTTQPVFAPKKPDLPSSTPRAARQHPASVAKFSTPSDAYS